ncbi:hypothetical protein CD30_04780 [Ureibacillus massiliensis 4400831 = CIP 108448 = CCUG 49529]|uniref:Peptidase C39-like domain-containing protein n=1 Tax=Ureibacillus massiliensis 4400831 = CIP 108448 = CCUG 49529 TaxID=1211035 RepID=A0A0A3J795_9BACL|nr:C39 family peptidase [Ureibacillus massiliensis]KGR91625.1 hypothetical protein CD30_04780 [Ureibacillus massiliensis 4400831 = CIP 108448 = CCUG 49529]
MKTQLNVKGISQFSNIIDQKYQSSACGPTTIHVILNYMMNKSARIPTINALYQSLGCTKIGLFKWRLIKNLQRYLGPLWNVSSCSLYEALNQIDLGRPVALKFDKYFSFQWNAKPAFKYHWVPLIGYEFLNDELFFIIHDNGGKYRDSQIRKVRYADNEKVTSFVKIEPK